MHSNIRSRLPMASGQADEANHQHGEHLPAGHTWAPRPGDSRAATAAAGHRSEKLERLGRARRVPGNAQIRQARPLPLQAGGHGSSPRTKNVARTGDRRLINRPRSLGAYDHGRERSQSGARESGRGARSCGRDSNRSPTGGVGDSGSASLERAADRKGLEQARERTTPTGEGSGVASSASAPGRLGCPFR